MESKQIAIAWADLTYKVKPFVWSPEKTILNKLFGCIEFGTVTALMGPSGAGKTTLLNCINGKISDGFDRNTKIYLNKNQKIRSSFVGQHEREQLILCLTTKENLLFASKVKNSGLKSEIGPIDHNSHVMAIMDEFLITDISDTRVEFCSGGQQKRLTIALEMTSVIKPNMICIDEPTTGLDSNIAEIVMECLKKLANDYNIAIITSIHQPNNEIALMFDKIYVLAKGGHCLFNGCPDQINTFLNENDAIEENQVPVEQLLKLVSIEPKDEMYPVIIDMTDCTRESLRDSLITRCKEQTKLSPNGLKIGRKTFKFQDFWYLMLRFMKIQYIRQWRAISFQLAFYMTFAITTAKMFNEDIGKPSACFTPGQLNDTNTCVNELENDKILNQNQNFLYFSTAVVMFTSLVLSTASFSTEIKIFLIEHQNGWYSSGAYFLAKSIIELFPTVLFSVTYALIAYYISGQILERERLIGFILTIVLGFLSVEGTGHISGIIFQNNATIAVLISMGLMTSMNILSNYYLPTSDLPETLQSLSNFFYTKYVFESSLLLVYGLNRCKEDESSIILLKYNIKDEILYKNYFRFVIYILITRIISFIVLYLKTETRIHWRIKFSQNNELKQNTQNNDSLEMDKTGDEKMFEKRMSIAVGMLVQGVNFNEKMLINENNLGNQEKSDEKQAKKICILWKNLTLFIPKSVWNKEKMILKKINGFFEFGSLNALMGSSGAGKTSLLKAINGLYNEFITNKSTIMLSRFKKINTCFITQNVKDHILVGLTARQAVTYASKLKNNIKDFDHKTNVETIMTELMIDNTYETNVERCSGGEQKRLVIAMEMTADVKPNLLCIDEPTSGLDGNAAEVVIKSLKKLSKIHSICVVTSIHQPNNDILMMFDKLYVLSKDGHCLYSGRPENISQHLSDCGRGLTESQVPIEVLLKYSCNRMTDTTVERMVCKTKIEEMEIIESREYDETRIYLDGIKRIPKRFFLSDLWLLLNRSFTYTIRFYWKIIFAQFLIFILSALMARFLFNHKIGIPSGCISFDDDFNNTCAKTQDKIENEKLIMTNMKYNLFVVLLVVFYTIICTIFSFVLDLNMFVNEQRNGWYSTGVYYWNKTINEFIPLIIIFTCFSYIIDIYEPQNSMFFNYLIFLIIGVFQTQSIGQLLGILCAENIRIGLFAIIGLIVFSLLFCNVLIPIKELHYSLQLVSNLVTIRLLFESLMLLFYGFDRCSDREFSLPLNILDIDDNYLYSNLSLLVIQFLLYRIIVLLFLILKVDPMVISKENQVVRRRSTLQIIAPISIRNELIF